VRGFENPGSDRLVRSFQPRFQPSSPAAGGALKPQEGR
jgi:hypothetical protein